jgi:serine/threonine protein kinase
MGAFSPIETIQALGKYDLLEKIGEGYLGSVFRGIDHDLGQAVAVRVLCDGIKWDAQIENTYSSQCRAVVGLRHAGIASVLAYGADGPYHYIVQESLGNSNLRNLIAQQPAMTVEAKLSIMIQVAEALSFAHKNGIVHRDLGPAKLHITADGNAKIRDFAIANVLMKHLPHPWIRFGTPIYLSPEQIQQKSSDQRSDIFSLGTVFYEFLTYHHPFYDRDSNKSLDNILQDVPVQTFDMFPDQPPGIWPILKTCLARDPDERYQSMEDVSSACRSLLKDLAEDSRLILSELYAALNPLRRAAASLNAPAGSIQLLHDIETLLRGEKEIDYISLDRLMNALIEQYPAVQTGADSLPALDPDSLNNASPEINVSPSDASGLDSPEGQAEIPNPSHYVPELGTKVAHESAEAIPPPVSSFFAASPDEAEATQDGHFSDIFSDNSWDISSKPQPEFETCFAGFEDDKILDPGKNDQRAAPDSRLEPDYSAQTPKPDRARWIQPDPIPATSAAECPAQTVREEAPGYLSMQAPSVSGSEIKQDPRMDTESPAAKKTGLATCYRRIRRPSYRTTVVLLSLLLIVSAAYIVWGTDLPASLTTALKSRLPGAGAVASVFKRIRGNESSELPPAKSVEAAANSNIDAQASPIALDSQMTSKAGIIPEEASQPPKELVSQISALISAGKLPSAKVELDRLQRIYRITPAVLQLRQEWELRNSILNQERTRKEEDQTKAARKQREDEWSHRIGALLTRGQYGEANSTINLWLAEDPGSTAAREMGSKIGEIQRNLNIYASAMAENKYQEALGAIAGAEKLNSADANFAELRRQIESKRAAARSSLTVYRLGAKAALFLDGRPIGTEGEMENEPIPIGAHTIAVESAGTPALSRRQEFIEGQRIALVYDLAQQQLRAMADGDRELLAQRKTMEEVRYFDVEHEHGAFRGSCRGLLMIDFLDVAYRPSAGSHGFRIPFKLLKLSVKGRSVELIYVSDNRDFQSFKLRDDQAAEKLKRSWNELKAMIH